MVTLTKLVLHYLKQLHHMPMTCHLSTPSQSQENPNRKQKNLCLPINYKLYNHHNLSYFYHNTYIEACKRFSPNSLAVLLTYTQCILQHVHSVYSNMYTVYTPTCTQCILQHVHSVYSHSNLVTSFHCLIIHLAQEARELHKSEKYQLSAPRKAPRGNLCCYSRAGSCLPGLQPSRAGLHIQLLLSESISLSACNHSGSCEQPTRIFRKVLSLHVVIIKSACPRLSCPEFNTS